MRQRQYRKGGRKKIVVVMVILVIVIMLHYRPKLPQVVGHPVIKVIGSVLYNSDKAPVVIDESVLLYVEEDSMSDRELVSEAVSLAMDELKDRFGMVPEGMVRVFVHKQRSDLAGAVPFGQERYIDSLGLYHAGSIHLLAPSAWCKDDATDDVWSKYLREGPVLHEMVHWYVDEITRGNCPLWLNEGVAQYIEKAVIGYEWIEEGVDVRKSRYGLKELSNQFQELDNTALAYRESLLLVEYLIETRSFRRLYDVLMCLGSGVDFSRALDEVYCCTAEEFFYAWELGVKE